MFARKGAHGCTLLEADDSAFAVFAAVGQGGVHVPDQLHRHYHGCDDQTEVDTLVHAFETLRELGLQGRARYQQVLSVEEEGQDDKVHDAKEPTEGDTTALP